MQNLQSGNRNNTPELMPTPEINQLHSWQLLLNFMTDENIHLKNRLSKILSGRFDKDLLEETDGFQNRFVRQDEITWVLRHDVAAIKKLLNGDLAEDGKMNKKIIHKINTLSKNMLTAEKNFTNLKTDFNHFLLKNIL